MHLVMKWYAGDGKKGFKGRTYPAKKHASSKKARQFALELVNSKIIEGYNEISTMTPHVNISGASKTKSEMVLKSKSIKSKWRKPPKKRESLRNLRRQSSVILTDDLEASTPLLINKQQSVECKTTGRKWRKPHKKQSTIRRLAKLASTRRSSSVKKILFDKSSVT